MVAPWIRLKGTSDHELHTLASNLDGNDGSTRSYEPGRIGPLGEKHISAHKRDLFPGPSSTHDLPRPSFGVPTAKTRLPVLHLLAAITALICLALGVAAVANERISWHLGVNNRQIIVLGFLLSIMNLCLGSVTPTLFLHVEARFGSSTLQNYNGILRNQVFSSRLGAVWRLTIGLTLALPLGLSVAYKTFTGGSSAIPVDAATVIGNDTYYGMFAPPGLQLMGEKTGVSLFSNATLPFAVASSRFQDAESGNSEPPLPTQPKPYGFNILLLNNESSAILDIPQPSYVSAVQALLADGESWNVSAPVYATVATFNHSSTKHKTAYEDYFSSFCQDAQESSGAYTHTSMMNEWSLVLLNHASPGDQSLQYIGLMPDPGIQESPPCEDFLPFARLYDINRQKCNGTWRITRGSIELVNGSCYGVILPEDQQEVIVHNSLFFGVWYMPSLVEFLGQFATSRANSEWTSPYTATALAAMVWSRISVLNTPISRNELNFKAPSELARLTPEKAGLTYQVNDSAQHIRPTLRKSGLLGFVLAIQPLLIILVLALTATMFHSAPLGKGFGLVSIMSGIDRDSLDYLAGATLSGKLTRSVKLVMRPTHYHNEKDVIEYHVMPPCFRERPMRSDRLTPKIVYH
ncbi:MAG: hypothetical protein LQ350_004956 [Teloschistes chrysophthalmus]|nr:MAG: hypothetical protein LQ350_004956 [Niorma chrysophthalma]